MTMVTIAMLVSHDIKNSHLGKINRDLGEHWNEKGLAEIAPISKTLGIGIVGGLGYTDGFCLTKASSI